MSDLIDKEMLSKARRLGEKFTGYSFEDSRALGRTIVVLVDNYERRVEAGLPSEVWREAGRAAAEESAESASTGKAKQQVWLDDLVESVRNTDYPEIKARFLVEDLRALVLCLEKEFLE